MAKKSIYSGQKLRKLRRERELTQIDLECESGISSKRISRWEREGFPDKISAKDIKALCEALDCEPARLEKPLNEQIRIFGLDVLEDLLCDPATETNQLIACLKYCGLDRAEQSGEEDAEQKDLTEIFNKGRSGAGFPAVASDNWE